MDILKEFIRNMFVIILILSFIELILPQNSLSKYIKYIFSLIILITILHPITYLILEYK